MLAGLGGGYGLGYTIYEPQLSKLQTSYDSLNTTLQFNVSSLQSDISNLQSQLTDLNITYAELQENYTELLSKYQQLEALVQTGLPNFTVIEARYEIFDMEKYIHGIGTGSGTAYVMLQNIGNSDAHDISINVEVELYDTQVFYGTKTLPNIISKEVKMVAIKTNQSTFSSAQWVHFINITITCLEGITQEFTLEY